MIMSIGYRVKSKRGIQFRKWANTVLKQYLLRGYAVNQRIEQLERRVFITEQKIDFFVRSSLPPVEGIFYDGQIFDAYAQIISLIKQAKQSIILIDNYINVDTLTMLSNRSSGVTATIYTRQLNQQQQLDLQRHNQQQETLCLHQDARDSSSSSAERYIIFSFSAISVVMTGFGFLLLVIIQGSAEPFFMQIYTLPVPKGTKEPGTSDPFVPEFGKTN